MGTPDNRRLSIQILLCLLAATGASVLLQEEAFQSLLSTVVGADGPASAIVLGVFFLGLALGGVLGALVAPGLRHPLWLCAGLEAFIGGWCLWLALSFRTIQAFSGSIVSQAGENRSLGLWFLRAAVALLWILPPSTAAGASFPAILASMPPRLTRLAPRIVSRLYSVNLIGAAIGAAVGCFLLFPNLGLTRTLQIVALVQGAAAATLVGAQGLLAGERRRLHPMSSLSASSGSRGLRLALAAGAFVSGFCFFSFEVLWVHLVGSAIGASVYAFGTVLAIVLGSLAVGGAIAWRAFRRRRSIPVEAIAWMILGACAALVFTFPFWPRAPLMLGKWGSSIERFGRAEILRFAVASLLIAPPAALLGVIYPALFRSPEFPREDAARGVGLLQTINAAGCVLGALATGFLLVPALTSEGTYRLLAFSVGVLALALLLLGRVRLGGTGWRSAPRIVLAFCALATGAFALPRWDLLALTSGLPIYFRPAWVLPESRLLFYGEDLAAGLTTVIANPRGEGPAAGETRMLLTNGKMQGDIDTNQSPQVFLGVLPLLHQPRRERALLIGLGTGQTAHVLAASRFRRLDIAEISPSIVEASRRFFGDVSRGIVGFPNVRLLLEDGRNVLLRCREPLDMIVVQINSSWLAGASNLYSREFYELARDHLTPDGVLEQWFPLHHVSLEDLASAALTLRGAFPHVALWGLGNQGYFLASASPLRWNAEAVPALVRNGELASDLEVLSQRQKLDLSKIPRCLLLDENRVSQLSAAAALRGVVPTTDSNRKLEYVLPRRNFDAEGGLATSALLEALSKIGPGWNLSSKASR